ncbi:HtaA domain-containing protein [Microbacterium koreense]|uniref:HtaA domain-containing protein n=1 Tax=Microbacterium koreense TaxID=323761 RepID=A0ABW2ZP34_9MICO
MNIQPTAASTPAHPRITAVVASLLTFFLVLAGAFVAPPATAVEGSSVTGTVTSATTDGLTVQVSATGLGEASSAYAALIAQGAEANVSGGGGYAAFAMPFPAISDGAASFTLTAPAASLDRATVYEVIIWQQHSNPDATTIYGRGVVAVSGDQWDAVFPPAPDPTSTTTTVTVDPAAGSVAGEIFTLGATVEPAASGTVEYFVDGASVGSAVVGETVTTSVAAASTVSVTASFTPTDAAAFAASTSAALAYTITAPAEPEEPTEPVAELVVSVSGVSAEGGVSLEVEGSGLGDVSGAYAALIEKGSESSVGMGGGYAAFAMPFPVIVDGETSFSLTAAPEDLDRSKTYEVIVWKQHSNPDASTMYARADAPITADDWNTVFPAPVFEPAVEVFREDGVTPVSGGVTVGETLVVSGTGFDPAANVGGRGAPIPATLPQGTYVVFGHFAETWQPSQGAASSARQVGSQMWALAEGVLEQVPDRYQGAIRGQWAPLSEDGSFSTTLTVTETSTLVDDGSYGVFTYGASGVSNADQEVAVRLAITPEPELVVSVSGVSAEGGVSLEVEGSGLGDVSGAYAALIEKGSESSVGMGGGYAAFAMPFPVIVGGETSFSLTAAPEDLDRSKTYEVIVWKQHSNPDASTMYARADAPITADDWNTVFPVDPVDPTDPTDPTDPEEPATPPAAASGSMRWAISSSFSNYVTGGIAKGSIAVSGGATRSNGVFQFGQAVGSTFDAQRGTGSVTYRGAVRFSGHGGILDVSVANPEIRATSPSSAALYVTSGGARVHFATLDLGAAARTTNGGAVTFTAAPATLTSAGRSQVFQGYGTSLDPVTFTVGSAGFAPSGSTGTVAQAAATPAAPATTLPDTPPATTGIDLDSDTREALEEGRRVTVSASGFEANEEGVLVVVYSTPVVLDEVTADASGVATWTGSLPASLADGEHTLTFQGSVDRGVRFTLARQATIGSCVVEDASLNWGFKESFRTYIEGIAAGGWELTEVVYEYPDFVWTGGRGNIDPETQTGLVAYGGTVRFTGHSGALDTTFSDARIELDGDTGYVVFDIVGETQGGDSVDQDDVRFAEFAVPDLELVDGNLVLDALPTTLTDAGAAAFGTYAPGEALDPVSAVVPVEADCGVTAPVVEEEPVAQPEAAEPEATAASESSPVWPWAVGGIALVLVVAAATWIVIARRRSAHGPDGV